MNDVRDRYDPHAVEEEVRAYWSETDAYETTTNAHRDDPSYFFVDGPPYTTGAAHMGTTWNKVLKDAFIRYFRMTGLDVTDRPGYDMHGLPIETRVEERLGFENKKDIEEFGMENFIEECRTFAEEQLDGLQHDFIDFGVWMDWDDPYKTITPEYMEAAWWGFRRAHERGLVEQGKRSISQCPRCETGLANNEVEFEDIEDPSVYVLFPLTDRDGSLVIWTTTPWTIPGNTFVAVAGELTYGRVEAVKDGETEVLWIAEDCVEEVLKKGRFEEYEVTERVLGEEMVEWSYEHPLAAAVPDHPSGDGALQVYTAEYVEADRTGLVHSAPGHGEEDFNRGMELGLDLFCPVAGDGVFTDEAGAYAGTFVRDANADIRADLDEQGLLLADESYVHSFGHCWRCDTGIIQIVTDQWFITVTDIKDELLANIAKSEWYPSWARDNRFLDFVENSPDWNVSRQRYWGIPLPIWVPEDAPADRLDEDMIVIGTRAELADRVDQTIDPSDIDLHRPTVDRLTITENGTTYRRVPDVFDVWLDSSVASWGTLGYPERTNAFEELWPADLIIEAHDQTRGWFWSQLGMSTAAIGEIPYKTVLMYGHALMPDGRAMSKSRGILVDPHDAIERHGRDVMRVFLLSTNPQGEDMRFSWEGMETMHRHLNILWHVFRFPLPYMDLDGFDPDAVTLADVTDDLELVDRWVLSRLQSTIIEMTEGWRDFRPDRSIDALLTFIVEDVSRFYIQEVRERMWAEEESAEKRAAYATLYEVLTTVSILLAPFAPFIADKIYGTLTAHTESTTVHADSWPTPDEQFRDIDLERDLELLRRIEEAAANARQQAGRKLRWPIQRVIVETNDEAIAATVRSREDVLRKRVNAKALELVEGRWDELVAIAEPRMDVIGPTFGEQAGEILQVVQGRPREELESGITVAGESVSLTEEMLDYRYEPPEDVAGTDFDGGTVYVDVTLTDDIKAEGYAREVVRRIQEMRKRLDLDIEEPIRTSIEVNDELVTTYLDRWWEFIAVETRTDEFIVNADDLVEEWDVEGTTITIGIESIPS